MASYLYEDFCSFTHASNEAQQFPYGQSDFYEELNNTLIFLSMLIATFVEIFNQYFGLYADFFFDTNGIQDINNAI